MESPFGWKSGSFVSFSFIILLSAFLYKRHADEVLQNRMNHILTGLLRAEKKVDLVPSRVALGMGGCEDVFAGAMDTVRGLNLTAPASPRHHMAVHNREQLGELLAFFFQHGAAAERYVANAKLFDELLAAAKTSPSHRFALGGNAPVMARRMALEGLDVMLGARLTSSIAASLPDSVKVVGETLERNDVHLVLEYDKAEIWGSYQAPRANRLIVHSDVVNPYLSGLEEFAEEILHFNPALVVIGGLQMMDNFPYQKNEDVTRLEKLQSVLKALPPTTQVHFELASFTLPSLLQGVLNNVIYHSDSLGMNEQELPNLVALLEGNNVTLVSDSHPRVAAVLDQMRTVYRHLKNTPTTNGRRRLTRLHIHTLAFQAILTTKLSSWKNTMSASAKAALTAHRHVCGSHMIDLAKTKVLLDDSFSASQDKASRKIWLVDNNPVSCWEEDDFEICVAPGLVCTHVLQTAGGGDNISSAGLVLQI